MLANMNKIMDGLWLGSYAAACDPVSLKKNVGFYSLFIRESLIF